MKKRMAVLVLLLLLLCACNREQHLDIVPETQAPINEAPILNEQDVLIESQDTVQNLPNFHSEYAQAIETYRAFLAGEAYYISKGVGEDSKVTIAPNYGGRYTLIDMNDDGIPELVTNVIIRQYRDEDNIMYWSTFTCGIYTYQNGEIVEWYQDGKHAFELLSNKALLFEYEGLGGYNYVYIELDSNGEYSYYMRAFEYYVYNKDGEREGSKYYISFETDRESRVEVATEEEWLDLLAPYLSLQTDIIPWHDYTL